MAHWRTVLPAGLMFEVKYSKWCEDFRRRHVGWSPIAVCSVGIRRACSSTRLPVRCRPQAWSKYVNRFTIRLWGGGARTQRSFGRLWKGWPATDNLRPERHRARFGASLAAMTNYASCVPPILGHSSEAAAPVATDRAVVPRPNWAASYQYRRPAASAWGDGGCQTSVHPRQHRRVIADCRYYPSRRGANDGIPGSRAATLVAPIASGCSHG